MNLADMDMKKEFEEYNKLAPVKTVRLNGGDFAYRYYKNPNPKVNVTLLVLAGGTGLAEGMFAMAKSFMDKYSLISFNYPKIGLHGMLRVGFHDTPPKCCRYTIYPHTTL